MVTMNIEFKDDAERELYAKLAEDPLLRLETLYKIVVKGGDDDDDDSDGQPSGGKPGGGKVETDAERDKRLMEKYKIPGSAGHLAQARPL